MKSKQDLNNLSPEMISALAQHLSNQRSEALESYLEKQNRLLDKKIAEEEEANRIALEQRRQGALALEAKKREEENKQLTCPHIKPNRVTAIAGQRDHSGNTHFVCQLCSKNWTNNELPNWLTPDSVFIGGPIR